MAEPNVIQKIIRLLLDRKSADDVEKGTKETTGKIDAAWKDLATRVAGYLGLAFLTKKVVDFGKAAVKSAMDSQAAWSDLAGTIDANGASFEALENQLRATGDAFEDAFAIDDDKFAATLSRVVSLTGDVDASMNNMVLVADVAAKFFNGELEPAANLVAKAMNGNTAALQKMGIKAESAQQALEILATRSMGAAERRAQTFAGQLASVNNLWDDFLKDVGNAIIQSDGAASAFDVVKAAIKTMSEWVGRNREAISQWVTRGVNFAIDALDVLFRATVGMAKILAGGFQSGLAVGAKGLAMLTRGYVGALNAASAFLEFIGQKEQSDALDQHAAAMLNDAKALDEWADAALKAGSDKVFAGLDRLSRRAFSSDQFGKAGKGPAPGASVPVLPPQIGKNAELSDVEKAFKKFDDAIGKAKATIDGTSSSVAFLTAQSKALETVMDDLTNAGVKPTDEWMRFFADSLRQVNAGIEEAKNLEKIAEDWENLARATESAALTMPANATNLEKLTAEADRLKTAIQALIADGLDPQDESLQNLVVRLGQVQEAMEGETEAMAMQKDMAASLAEVLFVSLGNGIGPFARMKAKQNYLEAAELAIRAGLAALTGFGAVHAGKFAAASAQHAAMGLAWSALASVNGSGGGGGSVAPSGGSAPSSSSLNSARSTSSSQSVKYKAPEPITQIHFIGPGFDALNPKVQAVVLGAQQQALELNGPNANVRVIRRSQ